MAAAGDKQQAVALGLLQIHFRLKIIGDTVVAQPLRAADHDALAVHAGLYAPAGGLLEIGGVGQGHPGLFGQIDQRLGRRVVAEFFRRGGDLEQFGRLEVALRGQAADRQFAGGQRASLVEHKGVDARRDLDVADVLDEDAQAGGRGQRGDHRRGRGEDECARAGDHQHRDNALDVIREKPDDARDHQHERRVVAHVLVDDPHDRQLGLLGGKDEVAHAAKGGVLTGAGDLDFKHSVQVGRAGKNLLAGCLVHRERLAGDVCLVDGALALDDYAISRDVVAGANPDHVAHIQFGRGHFLLAGRDDAAGLGRGHLDERRDGGARTGGGAGLDLFTQQHEKRDDAGGLVAAKLRLAGGNRCEKGDGDQLVDGEHAAQDALDRQLEDRVAKDDRPDERTDARDPVVRAAEPLHEE